MLDIDALSSMIADIVGDEVSKAVQPLHARIAELEARPAPEKGEKGDPGEPGADGVTPEIEAVAETFKPVAEQMIAEAVSKAVAEIPLPERGEKGEPGDRGEPGEKGTDGANGQDGRDGADVTDFLIDRDGSLIATLSTGTTKNLGPVIGKDGAPGKDGRDGFGFDDMDVCVLDDDRTIELSFRRGEDEKAFTLKWPTVIDRGVFKADREAPYEPGDGCTWGGQFYICNEPTNEKPDLSKDGKPWRLAVRKGRDGKDRTKE